VAFLDHDELASFLQAAEAAGDRGAGQSRLLAQLAPGTEAVAHLIGEVCQSQKDKPVGSFRGRLRPDVVGGGYAHLLFK
jgi:hypothetical protein